MLGGKSARAVLQEFLLTYSKDFHQIIFNFNIFVENISVLVILMLIFYSSLLL